MNTESIIFNIVLVACVCSFIVLVANLVINIYCAYDDRRKDAEWIKIVTTKRMKPLLKDLDRL